MSVIGIDLDNTIVQYDAIIHDLAVQQGLIPAATPQNKTRIRNILRGKGLEDEWTAIQGYVYGEGMEKATPFPGIIRFLERISQSGYSLCIISHRSKSPYTGGDTDLHLTAMNWLKQEGITGNPCAPVPEEQIFFELTKEAKYDRIRKTGCHTFIDDLVEFLTGDLFPPEVRPVLFDPCGNSPDGPGFIRVQSWDDALLLF